MARALIAPYKRDKLRPPEQPGLFTEKQANVGRSLSADLRSG